MTDPLTCLSATTSGSSGTRRGCSTLRPRPYGSSTPDSGTPHTICTSQSNLCSLLCSWTTASPPSPFRWLAAAGGPTASSKITRCQGCTFSKPHLWVDRRPNERRGDRKHGRQRTAADASRLNGATRHGHDSGGRRRASGSGLCSARGTWLAQHQDDAHARARTRRGRGHNIHLSEAVANQPKTSLFAAVTR